MLGGSDVRLLSIDMFRFLSLAICVFTLTACETMEQISLSDLVGVSADESAAACEERTVRLLDGVRFDNARMIDMEVRRGEFTPVVVRMIQNETYVLRLRNRDDEARVFHAPEFFENVAIAAVAIDNAFVETVCPGPAIRLEPGQVLEMQLYAAVDGTYDYYDSVGLLGQLTTWHPGGVVRIEAAY